jgi:hypothetical protein
MSLALFLISAFFLYYSVLMERPGEHWGTAPGLLPGILSASLGLMSGAVMLSSIRRGGLAALADWRGGSLQDFARRSWRLLVAMLAVAILYFGLLRVAPFEIAAILFFLFMTRVYWPGASRSRRIAVSLILPVVIALIFQAGFGVPLPGEDNIVERLVYEIRR